MQGHVDTDHAGIRAHKGALASAAGTLPAGQRRAIRALAIGLSVTRKCALASDAIAGFAVGALLERILHLGPATRSQLLRRTIMPIIENLKKYTERATGLRRPGNHQAPDPTRTRRPRAVRFKDDGLVPKHPPWPLTIYRGGVDLGERHDREPLIEDLFDANG